MVALETLVNTEDSSAPELPLWLKALECLPPDVINVLTTLAELGEIQIEDFIYQAMWEKMERDGELDRLRKEYGLSENWPFDEEEDS
jgi:hypothetical protein